MQYEFVVEIEEEGDRRIHLNFPKTAFLDFGLISEKISANNGKMPTVYGFLKGVINNDEENNNKEYVDAFLVHTGSKLKSEDKAFVRVVGMFTREDGDHKVLVSEVENTEIKEFADVSEELQKKLLEFHGFNKKIIKINSAAEAAEYLSRCEKE